MEHTIQRSEHLATLGRVAAGVAHEIRNPLASISGSIELLRSDNAVDGENRQLMAIALREIDRLDTLIGDLLDYARPKQPQRREPLDIGREITGIAQRIGSLLSAEDAPELRVRAAQQGLWITADRDQLSGVLWNLVQNAWQAGETRTVEIWVEEHGANTVAITVRDRGKGMTPEQRKRLFEPFYTTRGDGTGLGLAIVHRTVTDHGGDIEVESAPGAGTTFRLTFPRTASRTAESPTVATA
jgi:two-component system sensor histidine kinase PilS (NtrC family)